MAGKVTVIIDGDERGLKKAVDAGVRDLSRLEKAAQGKRSPQDFTGINTLSRGQLQQLQQFTRERQRLEQQASRIAIAEKKSELRQFEQVEKHKQRIAETGAQHQARIAEESARQVTQEKQSELRRFEQAERQKERLVELSARQRIQAEKLAAQHAENAKKREFQDFQRIERQKTAFQLAESRKRNTGTSLVGGALDKVGTVAAVGITAGFVFAAHEVIQIGVEYEKALNTLQAVTKATAEEMKQAAQRAKELGADISLPATSAKDAALAMTELAKAGLTVNQSMAAAKGVLQLAAAAQIDEARAAEIAANALNSFRLQASETVKVADLLAAASNASSAEIGDIAEAMQQASAVFAGAKINIETLTTAIALMANAGIKGSDAGTSLKTFLQRLVAPTDTAADAMKRLNVQVFDAATGKMKDLPNIIGQFEKALAGLTEQGKAEALNQIFGADAIRAAQILFATGTEGFAKMQAQVTQMGAAADLAAAKTKGLGGAWDALKSQLETIAITVFENVAPAMEKVIRGITNELAKPENERNWREAGAVLGKSFGDSAKKAFDQTFVQGQTPGFLQYIEGAAAQILPSFGFEASLTGLGKAFATLTIEANRRVLEFNKSIAEKIAGGADQLRTALLVLIAPVAILTVKLYEFGQSAAAALVNGLIGGIYGGGARVGDAISAIINREVIASANVGLEIKSPSKVFHRIGEQTIQGLIDGMEKRAGNVAKSSRRIANETIKAFREALKDFEKLAGASPQSIQTIEQTDRVREAAQAQREIIKLRKELGVNQGQPLPTTIFGTEDEIASLRRQKQAVEDLDKSYEKLRDEFTNLQDSQRAYNDDVDKALASRRTSGELALLDLAEEIDLMGVLDENQRREIQNLYEIERLRIELSDGSWGAAAVEEALEIARANQQARGELERIVALRKQVAGAESLGKGLTDELESLQRGGRELTEYERVLRQINTDYKDISDSQKDYLLNMARQIDAQKQFNEQYAETFNFIRDAFDILTEEGESFGDRIKNLFKSIADRFKNMVLDMATTWLTNKIFGVGGGGGFNLGGLFGGGGVTGTPNFNPNAAGGQGGGFLQQLFGLVGGGGGRSGATTTGGFSAFSHELGHTQSGGQSGGFLSQLFGRGGIFGAQGFGNNVGTFGGIGALAGIAGGFIGGKFGSVLGSIGSGISTGAAIGSIIPGIGTAIGAAIGGIVGFFSSIFGSPKQKKDKNENLPALQQGFADALKALRELAANKKAIKSDPSGAITQAETLHQQIASGFGIQFASSKYKKIAQQQIAARAAEAKILVDQIKTFAKQAEAASLRPILPEFADGGLVAQAKTFRGLVPGVYDRKDNMLARLTGNEVVLTPKDWMPITPYLKERRVPGFADGGFVGNVSAAPSSINQTVVIQNLVIEVESLVGVSDATEIAVRGLRTEAGQNVVVENVQLARKNKRL